MNTTPYPARHSKAPFTDTPHRGEVRHGLGLLLCAPGAKMEGKDRHVDGSVLVDDGGDSSCGADGMEKGLQMRKGVWSYCSTEGHRDSAAV